MSVTPTPIPTEIYFEILGEIPSIHFRAVSKEFRKVTDEIFRRTVVKYEKVYGLSQKFDFLEEQGYPIVKLYMILINHIKDNAFNAHLCFKNEDFNTYPLQFLLNNITETHTLSHTEDTLDLSSRFYCSLPRSIMNSTYDVLRLANNRFENYPQALSSFYRLRELDLSGNSLCTLSDEISDLRLLTTLNLSSNKLPIIPHPLQYLRNLTDLNLSNNLIHVISQKVLERLSSLSKLDLSRNRIKHFEGSRSLTHLNLSFNQIKVFPNSSKLPRLITLDLSHNLLTELPESTSLLKKLKILDASYNAISRIFGIPPFCYNLNLSHNQLQRVTIERWWSYLNLSNNPLTDLKNYQSVVTFNNTPYQLEIDNYLIIRILKQFFLIYLIRDYIISMKRFESL